MHFWLFVARFRLCSGPLGSAVPMKMGLYWFIPALANSRVGSSWGTTALDGKKVWPLVRKKSTNVARTRSPDHSTGPPVPFCRPCGLGSAPQGRAAAGS